MNPKILYIVVGLNVGGIETYLLRFLRFNKNNQRPYVLCKSGEIGSLIPEYEKTGAKIKLQFFGFISFRSWYRFYQYIQKEQFDSVCDFTGDFSGIPLLIAKLAGIKNRIVFYRESQYQFKPNMFKLAYVRMSNFFVKKIATKILSNSETAFKTFHPKRKIKDKRFQVIYNGINYNNSEDKEDELREKYGIPKNAFLIGHVGRFSPAKNHNTIVEVAKILCKKYEDVYFYLCGKGVEEGLKSRILEFGLQNRIITPGVCNNIFSHHSIMDLFLFPSTNEGQPNALLEAMISGLPIVSSNIPSILESVPNILKPHLIDPHDINSFTISIEKIKEGNITYNKEKIRSWAKEKFDPTLRFNEFYQSLTKE